MSGFFGIFRPGGGQIDMDQFDRMKSAMQRDGYDGMETHVEESIAVGHLMLRVGNASEFDKQPLKSDCGNYLLVGHFRLDYRDELGDKLGLTQSELERTPDSKLAMMAYLKWQDKCVQQMEGDWAFLIYSFNKEELKMYKNFVGNASIYYLLIDGSYVFSSSIIALTYLYKARLSFNIDLVKSLLGPFKFPDYNKLILEGIRFIPNGQLLKIRKSTFKLDAFDYKKNISKVTYKSELDYKYDYLNIIFSAVRSRINKKNSTGIFLSAGLDSTAVGFILAKEFEYLQQDLCAYTSIPEYLKEDSVSLNVIDNEGEIVKKFVTQFSNINLKLFDFKGCNPLLGLSRFWRYNSYNPIISKNDFWINGILDHASTHNVKSIFNAQCGNYTISQTGSNVYLNLLFKFNFFQLMKHLITQSKNIPFWELVKVQLAIPFVVFIKNLNQHKRLKNHKTRINRIKYLWGVYRESFKLLKIQNTRSFQRDLNIFEFTGNMWAIYAAEFSLEISDPTVDLRLIRFLRSIPSDLFFREMTRKYIYKKSFADLIPAFLISNTKRMVQSYDFPHRLFGINESLKKQITQPTCLDEHFFPRDKLLEMLDNFIKNSANHRESNELNQFLKQLSLKNFANIKSDV